MNFFSLKSEGKMGGGGGKEREREGAREGERENEATREASGVGGEECVGEKTLVQDFSWVRQDPWRLKHISRRVTAPQYLATCALLYSDGLMWESSVRLRAAMTCAQSRGRPGREGGCAAGG